MPNPNSLTLDFFTVPPSKCLVHGQPHVQRTTSVLESTHVSFHHLVCHVTCRFGQKRYSVWRHTPTLIRLFSRSQTAYINQQKHQNSKTRTPTRIIACITSFFRIAVSSITKHQTMNADMCHHDFKIQTVALTDRQRQNCNALVVCPRLMPPYKMLNVFTPPWTSTPKRQHNSQTPS